MSFRYTRTQPRTPGFAKRTASQKGFTLVEMAVVLIIIGVILGAVMIGRDAQRNAEYLRIRQTFINQWALAYNTYVQRNGAPPGDNIAAPRLMINGAKYSGSLGGDLTTATAPEALCEGGAGPKMARSAATDVSMRRIFMDAGVQLPQGRGVGMEDRYVYLDTNGNPQELQVCFQWNPPGTTSGSGNVMVITGLTPDLARSLSAAIKGNADASSGSLRQEGVTKGADAGNDGKKAGGVAWTGDNTKSMNDSAGTEGQVMTVIAHYKMNQ
jgi:prepilin-type N-terminal cleavage/methylation domain-containing protein